VSHADLAGPLLRSVSRSFYLTIRVLPAALREPIGLAYLLARASDTIADTAAAPAAERRTHLAAFAAMVASGTRADLPEIAALRPPHPGERELLAQLPRCLDWLASLGEFDRAQIRTVLAKIIQGQDLDLARFGDAPEAIALGSAEELEEYTYLVAGCVGEFWTDVCFHHLPRYSDESPARLRDLGRDYGKALQLVNILRDFPEDLRAGRSYLPERGTDFLRWHMRASALLEAGRRYIIALRPARLRAGCYLPWELARRTLALLGPEPPAEKRKVSRSAVRAALLRAGWVALSNRPLRA
jgi:farnesyl-diphosphate farnesyltransferase